MLKFTYTPFTYLIGWKQHDKWYYGVRYARNCHPDNLWVSYFTSSKHVKAFREEHGEPDVVEVRQTFNDSIQAREWEHKVLRRLKVIQDKKWLNRGLGKSIPPMIGKDNPMYGKTHTQEVINFISRNNKGRTLSKESRDKISVAHKGRAKSDSHREKLSLGKMGPNNPMYGKHHSEEHKNKIRLSLIGDKSYWYGNHHSSETIEKLRITQTGKHHSEETKDKMRKSHQGKPIPKITCEYCGVTMMKTNYIRWHGERCKMFSREGKI